jgi:hypothetical protein
MLISWARGGSLFSRGRGYNVSLDKPAFMTLCKHAASEKRLRKAAVDATAVHPGVPISMRHHRGHATAGECRHCVVFFERTTMTCVQVLQVFLINESVCTLAAD